MALEHDEIDNGAFVLDRAIPMARRLAPEPRQFAAHAHLAKGAFDRAFERAGDLADRIFGGIARQGWFIIHNTVIEWRDERGKGRLKRLPILLRTPA